MHNLTEPQWTDRFINRLGQLLPGVSILDVSAWAIDAYPGAEGPGPEEAAAMVASDLAPPAVDIDESSRRAVLYFVGDVVLTPQARARGIAAAEVVFDKAGIGAYQAARAEFRREGWDLRDCPAWLKPTDEEHRAADTWLAACAAATAVSGGGVLCVDLEPPHTP